MSKRFLTALTVVSAAVGLAPAANARLVAPPAFQAGVSKPLPAPAQQMLLFGSLGELAQGPVRPIETTAPVTNSGGGFDRNAAELGAVILLVGAGGALTIRRHGHRPIAH